MADRNDSLALDLDLFDNTKNGYVPEIKKKKKVQVTQLFEVKTTTKSQVQNEIKASRLAAAKACVIALAALLILGSLIWSRVVLTDKQSELSLTTQELELAQSENVRLQMHFNSMMSMDKIEEYAQSQLGMVKRENYQVSYFDISKEDGAEHIQ